MNEDIIISQALKNVLISDIEDYDRLPQYKNTSSTAGYQR